MESKYATLAKPYFAEAINNLKSWIKINSIYDEKTISKEKPFGLGVEKALKYIADLAIKDGFKVDRCDNYCTEISAGEGDLIAVYAHADVVPVSTSWKHQPFGATEENGAIYGRGTSDDKGPAMAAYYALKLLRDHHMIEGYKVTLVIGGNEESGSRCLEHYFNVLKRPYPKYGFTPDGQFPLIYGEKGICNYVHHFETKIAGLSNIEAGLVSNSVIDIAKATLEKTDGLLESLQDFKSKHPEIRFEIEKNCITFFGKAAHGSTPKLGINAGLYLLKFLGVYLNNDLLSRLSESYFDGEGRNINQYYESKELHGTTYNVGIINYRDNCFQMVVNFRYPENVEVTQVIENLKQLNLGTITIESESAPLLIDPDSQMVKTLHHVYQEETGDYETPIVTIGGGTYAKESRNTLAFGSAFPNNDDRIHDADEKITIKDFTTSIAIYARAIDALGRLK